MSPRGLQHRILNAESASYSPDAAAVLAEIGEVRLEELDRSELFDAVPWATALIVRLGHRVDDAVFAAAPGLRAVVTATTGLDHIDLDAADRRGIGVLSLRGETDFLDSIHATAEHTWALLLSLLRRVPWAHQHAVSEAWDRDRFRGRELADRTLGVVGLGRIGRKVAGFGQAFGMKVAAFDPVAARWMEGVERVGSITALARQVDVLSIHVPLGPETESLVDEAVLDALPAGALLVNTSRGSVVDEGALMAALEGGHLGGAALDVVRGETGDRGGRGSPLVAFARERRDVLLTPHIGGATLESMAKTEVFMARKLQRFLQDSTNAT